MEDKIPDILYHYCSVESFQKIVQNKTLRLSEVSKSNDSMECRWLEKIVMPAVFERELEGFLLSLNANPDPKNKKRVYESAMKFLNFPYEIGKYDLDEKFVLAICFSETPDLLSQWRGYAADGSGISIGFSSEHFKDYYSPTNNPYVNIKKVIYERIMQESEILPEIRTFVNTLKREQQHKIHGKPTFEPFPFTFEAIALWHSLRQKSIYIKNESFLEEKEWRFFTTFPGEKNHSSLKDDLVKNAIFSNFGNFGSVVRADKIVFFIDLILEKIEPIKDTVSWIRKIYTGPKCKLSEKDIRLLLELNGWDVSRIEIIKSSSSYT